jgi:hypothetical protein
MDTEPNGRVRREPAGKRDRRAAVRYRCSPSNTRTASTALKQWVLSHDRLIAETVQAESDMRARPPHERPGLVRLGALAFVPIHGGVLLDTQDDLGDARSRAVMLHYLAKKGTDVWYRHRTWLVRQATSTTVRHSRDEAGRANLEEDLDAYTQEVTQSLERQVARGVIQDFIYFGSGPIRDAEMARCEDMRLRGFPDTGIRDRCTESDIRDHLELYGYINTSGTVGRWHHQQYKALRGTARG